MIKKVAIIGCGAFGYALALLISRAHEEIEVSVTDVVPEYIDGINKERRHPFFHPEQAAPENIAATLDRAACLDGAQLVILAVPGQVMRNAARSLAAQLPQRAIVLNIAKALEEGTNKRMSEVLREELGERAIATLSGGMLAHEVAQGCPVGAEIACEQRQALIALRDLFVPTTVHVEITTDIAGVEYSGSFKNVIAIGAGIIDGLGFGVSSKAFYMTKALQEIEELAVRIGADSATFHTASQAWMGDLMTTCFGGSRNRYLGELIGQGASREEAVKVLAQQRKHAEGLATLQVVKGLLDEHRMKAPFLRTLYAVVYEGREAREAFSRISLLQHLT